MGKEFISIQDASKMTGKSIQTIRRLIKSKGVRSRKIKTPQGFNYALSRSDLIDFYKLDLEQEIEQTEAMVKDIQIAKENEAKTVLSGTQISIENHQAIVGLTKTIDILSQKMDDYQMLTQKLVDQGEKDKENFFRLIKTFQDRIMLLETQVKGLEDKTSPKWFEFWKA